MRTPSAGRLGCLNVRVSAHLRSATKIVGYGLFLVIFVAGASEIFLRVILDRPDNWYVWPPKFSAVFEASEETTPGVTGPGRFIINSLGIRADELPAQAERKILVLGGSTTIDVFLDQDEMWTAILQKRLNEIPGQPKTWVGNLGKSSLASMHHLLHFEHALPLLPHADLIIILIGVNDLHFALKIGNPRNMTYEQHLSWAFSVITHGQGFIASLALYDLYKRLKEVYEKTRQGPVITYNGDGYITWRQCRREVRELVDALPDLNANLAEYRKNLNELVDRAHAYGARLMFLTQPTLWQDKMEEPELHRLLAGGLGPNNEWCEQKRYFSPAALARAMSLFNDMTLETCAARGLRCIDLARELPKKAVYFYDDMHFSELGARTVGEIVAQGVIAAAY